MMIRKVKQAIVVAILVGTGCFLRENPHEERGDNYFKAGRYEDAFAEYTVALRQTGENPEIYRKMGRTSILLKDLKGARNAYFSLLKLSPNDTDMVTIDFFRLGIDFYEGGDDIQMAGSFESLFEVDSTYNIGEYYYYLADYYHNDAEFEKAVTHYTKALSYQPEHVNAGGAIYLLALSNEKMGNFRDALVYYEQFVRNYSDREETSTAEWHRGLCAIHVAQEEYNMGNPEIALEYIRIPISTGQPQVKCDDAWFLQGEIYLELEEPDSALISYEKVLELNPSRSGRLVSISRQRIKEIKFGD
jgi:tetratricopeptide (TPR) repeat protein